MAKLKNANGANGQAEAPTTTFDADYCVPESRFQSRRGSYMACMMTNSPIPTAGPSNVASTIITKDFATITLPRKTQLAASAPPRLPRQPSPLLLGKRTYDFNTNRHNAHALNANLGLVASHAQKQCTAKSAAASTRWQFCEQLHDYKIGTLERIAAHKNTVRKCVNPAARAGIL